MLATPLRFAADHPCFAGHFPGDPLVPGALLLDAVAAALRTAGGGRIACIGSVKFMAPLRPNEAAVIELEPSGATWRFRIRRGTILLVEGRLETTP